MPNFASPLQYPGGKAGLGPLLGRIIELNRLPNVIYAEPYAGGAGAGLRLLYSEFVSRILINDLDSRVMAFWQSILYQTSLFLNLFDHTPVTIAEWLKQRAIYRSPTTHSRLRVGFATFFLNRCNRSGILPDAGPIGGLDQVGKWKLDARYYREKIRERIEKVAEYKDRIQLHNLDALTFLDTIIAPLSDEKKVFVYLDPPYYKKGKTLYVNSYTHADHQKVATYLNESHQFKWVMSYDDVPPIRRMYRHLRQVRFGLSYTAYERRAGQELLIVPSDITVPGNIKRWIFRRRSQ